jgi:outer membrane receptor protein involved in Fe transport
MNRSIGAAVVCVLYFILHSPILLLHAQSGDLGSIEGTVTDPSGAAVAGVDVKARNVQTSATFATKTDEDGLFHFPMLPLGTYELTTEHDGFATLVLREVVVTVGARINLPLALSLAGRSESVVVSGGAPIVETTRSQVSTTVDSRSIASLPVHGRDFTNFVLMTPGVTTDIRGGLSFAGQRAMNGFLVDGVDSNDSFFDQPLGGEGFSSEGATQYHFSQDAVQEFQVNANSYSAEFGRASGGVTNAVTKSGTNQLHGGAFWFYRDRSLNANSPINKLHGLPKDAFHFNQFGGTFGGPLVRNKLFFFSNYESLRSNKPNAVFLNLPGFSLSSDSVVAGFQQRALDYLAPRAASWVRPIAQDVYLTKFDWHVASAHLLTARWSRQRLTGPSSEGAQVSFENSAAGILDNDVLAVSLTSTRSPALVNVARFAYVHSHNAFLPGSNNPLASISELGQLVLTIGRAPNTPQENRLNRGQWSDTLSYLRGRHSVKFGADVLSDWNRTFNAQNFAGNYRFSSLESFGRSLAGVPSPLPDERYLQAFSGQGTPGAIVHPNVLDFAGFVQDEWRVRPRLVLNLGLRYDLQISAKPPVKNPSPALAAAGIDTGALPTDTNNFAPRLGLAWAPLRDNRLVVRAGYGIFYSPTIAVLIARAHFQNGITVQPRTFQGGTSSAALIPAYPNNFCGPPAPSGVAPSCAPPAIGAGNPIITPFARDHPEPYVQQGSLGFELQLQKDFAISVSYLSAKGTHLAHTRDVNLGTPTTPTRIGIAGTSTVLTYQQFTLPRPIAGFFRILEFESAANSIYHGLAVQASKRFSHQFQFLASYTFGKVIDDNPNQYVANPGAVDALMISDPSDPDADRGAGSNDQRHRFAVSGVWELDYTNHLPRTSKTILSGWHLSAILTAQSGQPYSGLVSFDLNNDGNFANDRTPGLGRNTFYLPAAISFDPRVTRDVRLTERAKLQFIWEAFNVFNRTNITEVHTTQYARSRSTTVCGIAGAPCLVPQTAGLSAFGTPTATSGPRIMQLAARFVF